MHLLMHANGPWSSTGYGTQTRLIACELSTLGHEVSISAFYGLKGGIIDWECTACTQGHKYKVLPGLKHLYGADCLIPHAKQVNADLVIAFIDPFVLPEDIGCQGVPVYLYMPVDHDPLCELMKKRCINAMTIAYSRYGQRVLADAGIEADYVPHMIDCSVLYPEKEKQAEYKRWLGVPEDCFLIGIIAANKGERKAYPEMFEAIKRLMDKHDNIYVYCHTSISEADGRNLHADAEAIGLVGSDRSARVRFPFPYYYYLGFSDDQMRQVYNAADVLLATSKNEGFGLPILESQSCGTPVIVTDSSSMPELVGAGWKARYIQHTWTGIHSRQVIPDINSIYKCLEKAYQADRSKLIKPARAKALEYDRPVVREKYWRPALERIEQALFPPQASVELAEALAEVGV